jgi:hypothetical protein
MAWSQTHLAQAAFAQKDSFGKKYDSLRMTSVKDAE